MSRRLDLPIAFAVWIAGFAVLRATGSWLPLAGLALAAAARQLLDPKVRRLLVPDRRTVVSGVLGAAILVGGTYAGFHLGVRLLPSMKTAGAELYALMGGGDVALRLALLSVVALCEEILWRGRLLREAAEGGPPPWPIRGAHLASAVRWAAVYAVAHAASLSPLLVAAAFACGLFWGWQRILSRSLVPPVLGHVVWDIVVLVLVPLA